MRKHWTIMVAAVLVLLTFSAVWAGPEEKYNAKTYETLLKKLKSGDKGVDFLAMRLSYTKTTGYQPYAKHDYKAMRQAYDKKDYKKALEVARKITDESYVDIEAHMMMSMCYNKLGDKDKAAFQQWVAKGLIGSIFKDRDGKSPKTAFQVISVHEEYVLLGVMKLGMVKQDLVQGEGHMYDKLQVKSYKTGKEGILFFNVDIPIKAAEKMMKKK